MTIARMVERAQQPPFPRLSIGDFLVLTLTMSASFAVGMPAIREIVEMPDADLRVPRWLLIIPEITDYTTIGLALFGLSVLARERFHGWKTVIEPGHWIILATGPYFVSMLVSGAVHQLLATYWSGTYPNHLRVESAFFAALLGISALILCRGISPQPWRWRLCLALLTGWLAIGAMECVQEASMTRGPLSPHMIAIGATVYLLALISACVTVVLDLMRGVSRDWLHYSAMAMVALYAVSNALHYGALLTRWWTKIIYQLLP